MCYQYCHSDPALLKLSALDAYLSNFNILCGGAHQQIPPSVKCLRVLK